MDERAKGTAAVDGLRALVAPGSVAVIGASDDPARIGGRPVRYYREAGFEGPLYPVNPRRDTVQGLPAYPSIADAPGPVDFALIAVPAAATEAALDACGEAGVRAALIFTAGFAETGAEGLALQDRLMAIARRRGMRLLGPNCLGLFNARVGHCPTFSSALQDGPMPDGRVGLVTQSGAYGTHLLNMARARRIGVGLWASTGNEADVSAPELVAHLIESDEVDAIGCYMEAVNDADAFVRALALAREARKPLTIMKVGTSEVGAEAARSHTASLAGADDGFAAVLREFGAHRARTSEEMLDALYAAHRSPPARGRRLGIVTISGGAGVLMADAAAAHGLGVPPMPEALQRRLLERNPLATARNPVDVTAHALNDPSLLVENLEAVVREGGYDLGAAFVTSWTASPMMGPRILDAVRGALGGRPMPFAVVCQGPTEVLTALEEAGAMVFEDPSRAVAALAILAGWAEGFDASEDGQPPDLSHVPGPPPGPVAEPEAKAWLALAGVAVPQERAARDPQAAGEAADAIGYPVALKVASPDIAHKSEAGGVALDLRDRAAVERAAAEMLRAVARAVPDARLDGLTVGAMVTGGEELIVGTRTDPVFGPMVVVGLGGVFTEVLRDVAMARAPVSPARAERMLGSLRGAALLRGARGRPSLDLAAAADAIARVSVLAARHRGAVEGIEINPLRVLERGAVALDALILTRDGAG